jgi:hypothetical protein
MDGARVGHIKIRVSLGITRDFAISTGVKADERLLDTLIVITMPDICEYSGHADSS